VLGLLHSALSGTETYRLMRFVFAAEAAGRL